MDPFVAEIRIFPFAYAPKGWAWCNGQSIPIRQNTSLYALLGNLYGGNAQNFNLPNLQGCAPMSPGQAPGLSSYQLGQTGGSATVTLQTTQIPMHTHSAMATVQNGRQGTVAPNVVLATSVNGNLYQTNTSANPVQMSSSALGQTGNSAAHNNMMPYVTFYFNIAMVGIYPQRP